MCFLTSERSEGSQLWEPYCLAGVVLRTGEAGTEEVAVPAMRNTVSVREVEAPGSSPFVLCADGLLNVDRPLSMSGTALKLAYTA